MPRANKPTDEQIERAAELRAKGSSWEAVAQEMGLPASTLRLWPTKYADCWLASFRRAETDVFTEAVAEAIRALRKQLRSEEPVDVRDAAKQLLGFRVQLQRLLQQGATTELAGLDRLLQELGNEHTESHQAVEQPEEDDPGSAA